MTNGDKASAVGTVENDSENPGQKVLRIKGAIFKDEHERNAAIAATPLIRGASTGMTYAEQMFSNELRLSAYSEQLSKQVKNVQDGNLAGLEAMLTSQANTLDLMFNTLALKSAHCDHMAKMESYLRLALKAQSQCRSTVEALAEIKNPRPVAFVKQANIANGPQQVNNGSGSPSRAREEKNETTNELLEHQNGKWMDARTASQAGGSNQAMETMGAVDRTDDAGR
ncbi:hypothetical protein L2Y90_12940 [Burkholderia pyrrocinia]|uniref:hypothetical protein n=1 Tax=Burkholderia pyrrocinia TaxID=60550 RepID=UPI00215A7426|nr:hypothetical protein [Burkholderia pyrrocinia]UVE64754.1 hypothetical protein L2Y90_12940 [Burkholderia pyrrocinia]